MMTSLCTELYQIFLAQGLCVGLGASGLFVGSVSTVAPYFSNKRAFALGCMTSGASIGGIIFPIMIQKLIPTLGFPWAVRTVAFVLLGLSFIPILLLKSRLPPRKSAAMIDYDSFKDWPFMTLTFGLTFGFVTQYVPYYYIESFSQHIGMNQSLVIYQVSIMNGMSVFGRLIPSFFADKIGPFNMLTPVAFAAAIMCLAWIGIKNVGGTIAFSIIFGTFSGTYTSIQPSCITALTTDLTKLGTRLGMTFFIMGFGIFAGPPVAGALISAQHGDFSGAQIFTGVCTIIAGCLIAVARHYAGGYKGLFVKV